MFEKFQELETLDGKDLVIAFLKLSPVEETIYFAQLSDEERTRIENIFLHNQQYETDEEIVLTNTARNEQGIRHQVFYQKPSEKYGLRATTGDHQTEKLIDEEFTPPIGGPHSFSSPVAATMAALELTTRLNTKLSILANLPLPEFQLDEIDENPETWEISMRKDIHGLTRRVAMLKNDFIIAVGEGDNWLYKKSTFLTYTDDAEIMAGMIEAAQAAPQP